MYWSKLIPALIKVLINIYRISFYMGIDPEVKVGQASLPLCLYTPALPCMSQLNTEKQSKRNRTARLETKAVRDWTVMCDAGPTNLCSHLACACTRWNIHTQKAPSASSWEPCSSQTGQPPSQ